MTRSMAFTIAGLAAGFSGLAVLAEILTPIPLAFAEVGAVVASILLLGVLIRRAPRAIVAEVARVFSTGLAVGLVATLVYDAARTGLSLLDPSPYDPFEGIRAFGRAIVGAGAEPGLTMTVGAVAHFLNGSTFGVIYAMFAHDHLSSMRTAVLSGMAWGIALEVIQSILYPGWLGITTVLEEFLLISAAGHLIYGVTLGIGVRGLLLRRNMLEVQP